MARDYTRSSNIIYNPVEAEKKRHSSSRDYRKSVGESGSRDYRTATVKQEAKTEESFPMLPNLNESINNMNNVAKVGAPTLKLGIVAPQKKAFKPQTKEQKKAAEKLLRSAPTVRTFENVEKDAQPFQNLREIPIVGGVYRGLDAVADFTKPASKLAEQFYTPGAGLAPIAGFTGAVGSALSRVAPKIGLGTGLGQRVARGAIQEAAAGTVLGAGQSLAAHPEEGFKGAGEGAAYGGALGGATGAAGPLVGKAVMGIIERWKPSKPAEVPTPTGPTLGLPLGRADAAGRRPTPGEGVITPEYTFRLGEGNDQAPKIHAARNDLKEIDNELRGINQQYEKAIVDEFQYLKQSMGERGGVTQGNIITNNMGDVIDRYGRQSNNPKWYQDFFAVKGRKPSNKELYQLAKERIDNGFADEMGDVPSWKAENGYDDTVAALTDVRNTIYKTIGEAENAFQVTNAPLKSNELSFKPKARIEPEVPQTPRLTADRNTGSLTRAQEPTAPPVEQVQQSTRAEAMARMTEQQSGTQTRGFTETLLESDKPPVGFKEKLKSAYTQVSNQETLNIANKRINKDVEESTSYVLGNSRFTAEKATVAQRLIDHYNGQGNFQRAVDVAQKVSEEATKAGQSIQALSMFNRLTAEGVLIHATRLAKKTNEAIPLGAKEVKVTAQMASDITGLAQATQKMTGVKDLSNDVMGILDRAKAGEKLSETDTQTLKRFVNESLQFVKETKKPAIPKPPKAPQQPKDKRVRDNVASFLDAQEKAAKERLRAKGIRVSSTPLDIWADYAIIGAAKMGKGTIKFADWSEVMVKDLGQEIKPHLQQLYERSREAFEGATKKVTQQTISQAEKLTEKVIKTKELTTSEANKLRELAKKVSSLSGEAKQTASQDLQIILQALEKPGFLKRVSSVQTIGQLLNPKTQVRNALGNELFYRLERVNKVLSTPIDIARSKITGGARTVTFRTNNQGQYWQNWMRGLKAGWKGVNVNGIETQYDLGAPTFSHKYNPLTYLQKSLGAALKSFDTAAYMRAYNNTLGELATLRAINEGKSASKELVGKYIREADDNMMKIADEYGKYVTFQDNNVISKGLVALKKGLNFKQDFGIGDLVLKYPKTPGALLMRALEFSPAGFIRSASILARPIFKKEPNTAEVTQALSRAIIGSAGLSLLGYFLFDKGVLTGAASKDRDIRDLQKSAGQGQYQVNLSALMRLVKSGFNPDKAKIQEGDFLYTYDWMQPVSIAVSLGANVRKNNAEGLSKTSGLAGTAYNSFEGGLGTLTEQSVVSGLKRAAEGYPGQTITDKIMDIISDVPASFVPTFSNQVNQLRDNNKRETYSPNKLEQSLNKASAKIPGLAQKLPQQYDTLGEPKQAFQDNSPLNVLFNPGFSSRYQLSPEAKFIVDLINESGDQTLAPRAPSKSVTVDGQSIKLNGDMFSKYQKQLGEETRKKISKIDPTLSLKTRVTKTEKALNDAGDKVRGNLKKELKVR